MVGPSGRRAVLRCARVFTKGPVEHVLSNIRLHPTPAGRTRAGLRFPRGARIPRRVARVNRSVRQLAGKGDIPCGSSTEPGYLSHGSSVLGTLFPSGSPLDRLSPGTRRSTRYSRCCLVLERNALPLDPQRPDKRCTVVGASQEICDANRNDDLLASSRACRVA